MRLRWVPARANRQPACAVYDLKRPFAIMVLTIRDESIAEVTGFSDPELFPSFGLREPERSGR